MYFTNEKCQIFNSAIHNKIILYCQINAKLMPKFTVAAKLENFMPNSNNNAKQVLN